MNKEEGISDHEVGISDHEVGISDHEVKEVPILCGLPLRSKSLCIISNSAGRNKPFMEQKERVLVRSASVSIPTRFNRKTDDVEIKEDLEFKNTSPFKNSKRIVTSYITSLEQEPSNWKISSKRQQEVWGYWYQPDIENRDIRSKTYLSTSLKVPNGSPPLLQLTHFDFLQIKERVDDVGGHKNSWLNRACPAELKDRKFLIINIQITSLCVLLVQYFVFNEKGSTGCGRVDKMWDEFVWGSDGFRDVRLKLIPVIVEGPWLVRKAVPTKPCIIGTKVKNRYFHGANYFEVDIETDSSYLAKGILSFIQGYSNYSVNLIWLLEAVTPEELPERILAAAHLGYPEYQKAISLENMWK